MRRTLAIARSIPLNRIWWCVIVSILLLTLGCGGDSGESKGGSVRTASRWLDPVQTSSLQIDQMANAQLTGVILDWLVDSWLLKVQEEG
jgi:hypothetical protein